MSNPIGLKAGDSVIFRFGAPEVLTVIESNDCVVLVRSAAGETFAVAIGFIRHAVGAA